MGGEERSCFGEFSLQIAARWLTEFFGLVIGWG
jgi:hypothetical protein